MSKKKVEEYLSVAIDAIKVCKIAKEGKVIRTYRSNISGFGAAVAMGSFKAAVAFYSSDAKTEGDVKRSKLIQAMDYIVRSAEQKLEAPTIREVPTILEKIVGLPSDRLIKEQYLDASIALKLAMNTYELIDPDKPKAGSKSENKEG